MKKTRLNERIAGWIVHHPWRVILASLLAVAAASMGGQHLRFTTDYRAFFGPDNPQLRAYERIENTYTKNDNVFFVLAPKNGNVFSRETLAAVEDMTAAAWKLPYAIRVDSVTNFQYTYAEGDKLVVQDLVRNARGLSDGAVKRVREVALDEPLLARRLVSPEAHVTAVNVIVQLPGKNTSAEVPEVTGRARALVEQIRTAHPGIDVYLTGITQLNIAFGEASQKDMATLTPLSLVVIVVGVGLLLRGMSGTFVAILVVVMSVFSAMGLAGWLGISLTPPSASSPTIIMTLAIANTVHILATFFQGLRGGLARQDAMIESLRVNWQPMFLTGLTEVVGFTALNFADAPPFRDLGNIVAIGTVVAWLLSVILLPALTVVLPLRRRAHDTPHTSAAMVRLSEFVIKRRRPLLWGTGALVLLAVILVPRNELNDVYTKYFDESIPFRTHTDFVDKNLGGLYSLQYSLNAGRAGGVADPAFLRQVEAFAQWYRAQPEAVHVASLTDVMKRLNKNMHADQAAYYRLPDDPALAAQYLLLYEMSLPYGLDLNDQINVDKSATRLQVTLRELSVKDFLALERRAQTWLAQNAPTIGSEGISMTMMFAHIGQRNWDSMIWGNIVSLALITLTLIIALRSVRVGLVSIIPNIVPVLLGFGLWAVLKGQIGILQSVVISMTLGIVVDDTVHFFSKYLRARREHRSDPADAIRYAFSSVGTAIWVTTAVMVAGFLVLTRSSFAQTADMGALTAAIIAGGMLVEFLFLPPLLMLLEEKGLLMKPEGKRNEETVAAAVDTAVRPSRG